MNDQDLSLTSLVMKRFWQVISVSFAIIALLLLAYFFTYKLLESSHYGIENTLHVAYSEWSDQFFPSIPQWYPKGGGGVSLLHGLPVLTYLLVVFVHRISNLSLINAYYLLGFLAIFLTSLAIYIFSWIVGKKHLVGLLAGVLYLIAPISWVGLIESRMLPQVIAMTFFAFSLVFFHGFLTHHLAQSQSNRRRLWLVGCVVMLAGSIFADGIVGSASLLMIVLYALTTSAVQDRDKRERVFLRATLGILMVGFILLLLIAFYLIPQIRYARFASIGVFDPSLSSTLSIPPLPKLLGFTSSEIDENPKFLQFPMLAIILFMIGALVAFLSHREGREIYLMVILSLVCIFITQLKVIKPGTDFSLQTLFTPWPWLLILTVFIPVGGASGALTLTSTILGAILKPREEYINAQRTPLSSGLKGLLPSALVFATIGSIIAYVPIGSGYGPLIDQVEGKGLFRELASMEWDDSWIENKFPEIVGGENLVSLLPQSEFIRIDVSPYLEDLGNWILYRSDASNIIAEPSDLSLIKPSWDYQRNVFYSSASGVDGLGNTESLINSSRYFGIEYVFLDEQLDQQDIYREAGWDLVAQEDSIRLWRNPGSEGLATHTSRPAILVPEKPGREIFMTVFRLANDGFLPYEEATLIEGRARIDHYSLEDLSHFDVIFLIGYDYRDRSKAWDTLSAYVEDGGSLYVDTGWQFAVAEWEFEQAPDVIPVSRLSWTDYGMVDSYELGSLDITGDVDIGEFNPLTWEGGPWAVSGAESSDIRSWGRMVLGTNGRPLIVAGEYGAGKVVWSGMNLIGHSLYLGENQEELKLLQNIIKWLLGENEGEELDPPSIARDHPEKIFFTLDSIPTKSSWLYWREAYYPNWHAYLLDDAGEREIPVFRSGPGFMLMPIKSSSAEVSVFLKWESSLLESASIMVSIIGLILLMAITIDGLFLDGQGLTWIKIAFTVRLPRPFLDEETHKGAEKRHMQVKDIIPGFKQNAQLSGQEALGPDSFETPLDDEQETLLKSWLDEKDDEGDPWVNKMLDPDQRK